MPFCTPPTCHHGQNSGLAADEINPFLCPSIHPSILLSPSHPPVILPPIHLPSSHLSIHLHFPLPPSLLPSHLPSLLLLLPSFHSSIILSFHPSILSFSVLPLFLSLCSFYPPPIPSSIQQIFMSGTVLGCMLSWSGWSHHRETVSQELFTQRRAG